MVDDNGSLFRQKSLESLNDGLDLESKIKITTPSIVAVVLGFCVILIGFIIWSIYYEIETFQQVLLIKNPQNQTECIIRTDFSNYSKICKYKKLYLGEKAFKLNIDEESKSYDYIQLSDDDNLVTRGIFEQELDYKTGEKFYRCGVDDLELQTQSDKGYVVVKKESPISYLVNYNWNSDSKR